MAESNRRKKLLPVKVKPTCKYGVNCFRKNPDHLRQYQHPSPEETAKVCLEAKQTEESKKSPKRKIDDALENSVLLNVDVTDVNSNTMPSPRRRRTDGQNPPSPLNVVDNLKEKFFLEMPSDFFDMWEFCRSINEEQPSEVFSELGLHLVGPYDVLAKKISNQDIDGDNILCHWRYYYDPPEFQTVIKRDGDDWYHIGYFRDDPSEMPFALASNSAAVGPKFKLMGDNIFAAMNSELSVALKRTTKILKKKYERIQEGLQEFSKKKKYVLEADTTKTKARDKRVVAKTFHDFGIVVPYDKKRELGYRPIPKTNASLKSLLNKISDCQTDKGRLHARCELDNLITNLQFANDECDYGMGLELGIDLFCFGEPYLHSDISLILSMAYQLLHRNEYGKILQAHLKNRRKGDKLSIKDE